MLRLVTYILRTLHIFQFFSLFLKWECSLHQVSILDECLKEAKLVFRPMIRMTMYDFLEHFLSDPINNRAYSATPYIYVYCFSSEEA